MIDEHRGGDLYTGVNVPGDEEIQVEKELIARRQQGATSRVDKRMWRCGLCVKKRDKVISLAYYFCQRVINKLAGRSIYTSLRLSSMNEERQKSSLTDLTRFSRSFSVVVGRHSRSQPRQGVALIELND